GGGLIPVPGEDNEPAGPHRADQLIEGRKPASRRDRGLAFGRLVDHLRPCFSVRLPGRHFGSHFASQPLSSPPAGPTPRSGRTCVYGRPGPLDHASSPHEGVPGRLREVALEDRSQGGGSTGGGGTYSE